MLRAVCGSSLVDVGDSEPAAEVQLRQLNAVLVRDSGRAAPRRDERRPRTAGVEDLRADMRVQPGQRRGSSRRDSTAATASSAAPARSEKPNFWSSWAVAMNSWVCASTPTVTRTSTAWRAPVGRRDVVQAARSRSHESTTIRPDPGGDGPAQLGDRLVVAVHADPLGREASGAGRPPARRPCSTSGPRPSSASQRAIVVHRNAFPA